MGNYNGREQSKHNCYILYTIYYTSRSCNSLIFFHVSICIQQPYFLYDLCIVIFKNTTFYFFLCVVTLMSLQHHSCEATLIAPSVFVVVTFLWHLALCYITMLNLFIYSSLDVFLEYFRIKQVFCILPYGTRVTERSMQHAHNK